MKNPVFFVQNNYVERLTIPVAQFAHAHGYALEDRSASTEFDPENCGIDWDQYGIVMPYGSVQFMRRLKESARLGKYILHSEDAFSTAHWADLLGDKAVNHRGRLIAAGEVPTLLAEGQAFHVRPDRQDKAFIAAVFDADSWEKEREKRNLDPELVCWASPVIVLKGEWRCWVIDGKIVEISQYRKEGQAHRVLEADPAIHAAALSLAELYVPAPAVVMDIALTEDGFQVLEFNPIHGSGWYAARVDVVLQTWVTWALEYFTQQTDVS